MWSQDGESHRRSWRVLAENEHRSRAEDEHRQLIPEDKMDDVIRVLKEHLPGTEPQWYLEADIDLNPIHAIPSRFSVKFEEGVTIWLTCARQSPCSSGASHQVSR